MSATPSQARARPSVVKLVQIVVAVALTVWAIAPVLTERAKPLSIQPWPDTVEYADGAWQLGHFHGYVTFFNERTNRFGQIARPPRYPFGTSVALAPFAAVGNRFPQSIQAGSRILSVLYVLAIVIAAWLLGGPIAAAIAAVLVGSSPFGHVSASLILSDALAAMLTVAILIALRFRTRSAAGVAGLLAGLLVCVRLLGLVALPGLLIALKGRQRLIALAAAAPPIAALALYQWNTFGSPFLTGYNYWLPGLNPFGTSFVFGKPLLVEGPFVYPDKLNGRLLNHVVCPCGIGGSMVSIHNFLFYPAVLIGLFWIFAPPLTGLVGLVEVIRERASAEARFTLITIVLNVGLVMFYFDQAARFIAPAVSLLIVYAAVGISKLAAAAVRAVSAHWRQPMPDTETPAPSRA